MQLRRESTATPAKRVPMVESVVRVSGGVVAFGGRPILHGVDLDVRRGEVMALLGANGSGKSTLVRALVGLVPLSAGQVELFGTPLPRFRDWHRVGYVPQRASAAAGVPATVREVVASGRLSRLPWWRPASRHDREAVERALETVGLAHRARDSVAKLSGGQQQRVLIARALAGEPEVLLLDEPTAGVDLPSQQAFADTLRTLIGVGTTILLVSHELGPLEPLIERAVVLRDGRVVHDGPPPSPVGHHAHPEHTHVHPHGARSEAGWFL
ncbi:ABC transporter related protein [Carbonactinospora thermoautotrophica]|uniref:ABC transporter related protein n=4 Tax=Carbonactinospora thermoautotrophica TaxID=1469144 RepID=A0A132MVN1_9ACTN|nr:ABC transporter related protein [Carbonactinospora thermoautotrophica]